MRFLTLLFLIISTAAYAYNEYENYSAGAALILKYLDNNGKEVDEAARTSGILNYVTKDDKHSTLTFPQILYLSGSFIASPTISGSYPINQTQYLKGFSSFYN